MNRSRKACSILITILITILIKQRLVLDCGETRIKIKIRTRMGSILIIILIVILINLQSVRDMWRNED